MTAWWLPWTLPAAGIATLWVLMARAKREDARQTAERDARFAALREQLNEVRRISGQPTGWFRTQKDFDDELECIRIAEEALSRRRHPTGRRPHPHT